MRIVERRGGCVTNIILLKYNINTIRFYRLIALGQELLTPQRDKSFVPLRPFTAWRVHRAQRHLELNCIINPLAEWCTKEISRSFSLNSQQNQ